MMELLWLLLPVAAASGWLAARYSSKQSELTTTSFNLSSDYFKGLSYLLNEEPDKAIDIFIKLIEVDSDTVETHLALGVLFRRRGEVNRAIRLHQNLIARATLTPSQRSHALFELAQDYHRAGLLDRAETLFQQLLASETHRLPALQQLLDIYQQEQDWEQAIYMAQQLRELAKQPMQATIAQYYCEQADLFKRQQQPVAALQAIQQALTTDPSCVRASLLEGQIALDNQQPEQAIAAFKRVEQQNPDYLTEIIEPLQASYQQLGQDHEFRHYLSHILERYGGITPMLMLANIIKQQAGEKPAADFIVQKMYTRPSIRGLDNLLDLALAKPESITHNHLLLLKEMTTQLLKNKPSYKCTHCGFTARKLHWQCPSCKQWNTLKAIQEIASE